MKRISTRIIIASRSLLLAFALIAIIILCALFFGLIGAIVGGNFFTSFEAFDVRGYEATGLLGAIVGVALGIVVDALILRKFVKTAFFG
jgi:uncharacterized membrane protein YeaQ/YmgE (transglycosylase-associated protein family)